MDRKRIRTHDYYKRLYPAYVVLYRVGDDYLALGDDAMAVAQALGGEASNAEYRFRYDDLDSISKLGERFKLKMVSYRKGEIFDLPNILRLQKEQKEDY